MMDADVSRRRFLNRLTAGSAGLLVLPRSRCLWSYEANERVNVALIGVGGRGSWFVGCMPKLCNVVALCDVNDREADLASARIPDANRYHDFRRMLDEMDKETDGVVVATPDNTHAVISAAAIRRGKHVYCEKPLTHDIYEARTLRALAREHKVATQMGNQGTASRAFRRGVELIQAGVLGDVREVHVWNTGGGAGARPLPEKVHEIPDHFKWDLWLGPAQFRPYNSRWLTWHTWRDFATGALGNWACHTMNVFFKGLKLDALWTQAAGDSPEDTIRVDMELPGVHDATFPKWEILHHTVPARGTLPPVTVHWYNGGGRAPGPRDKIEAMLGRKLDWGDAGDKAWKDHAGCLLVGSEGMLHSNGHNTEFTLLPEEKFKDFDGPPSSLPRSRGHESEWLDACKGGPKAMSNFDYSAPLAEFVLLGNVATLYGKAIEYDPVAMRITNMPKANAALRRDYRQGWTL
jgi:predicted dehydrogenase